jgi:hypothetical protein
MKSVSDKLYRENQNTYFEFFFIENLALYETRWKNTGEWGRPSMTIWLMRIACWIPTATNAHPSCVTLIAFPQPQWLHERASVLRYTHVAYLVTSRLQEISFYKM